MLVEVGPSGAVRVAVASEWLVSLSNKVMKVSVMPHVCAGRIKDGLLQRGAAVSLEFGSGQNCGRTYQGLARVLKGTIPTIATASEQCQTLAGLDESINTPDIFEGQPGPV